MSFYSHGHAPSVLASHGTRRAANSAAYLLPELSPGVSILDIGWGPGSITLGLAETVAPGKVIGIDPSHQAIISANGAARERGLPNVTFLIADVHTLPFENDSFDVVHAHQVLQHLPDPVAALREMSRVCAPNGLMAVRDADYASMAWFPESAGLSRWLGLYRSIARANRGEPDAGRHLKSWADRVRASSYGNRALELGRSTQPELDIISTAWETWSREPDAWFAMLHTEILARPALAAPE